MNEREIEVRRLWRARPRSRFLRASVWVLAILCVGAYFVGDFEIDSLFSNASAEALHSFAQRVAPKPVRGGAWDWHVVGRWAADLMATRGWKAAGITLAISVAAIVLAAMAGLVLSLFAARTFATPEPFLPAASPPRRLARGAWAALRLATRGFLIFLRSIPEYLWAFLLFGILGANAWPAVLALAIHNAGILGRLDAEVFENLPPDSLRALRALGAGRAAIVGTAALPAATPRLLLYFFYRWETCVREATVLGMLGIISLGYWIDEARYRFRYDELVFWILVGAAIVLLGDLVSAVARRQVRRAS